MGEGGTATAAATWLPAGEAVAVAITRPPASKAAAAAAARLPAAAVYVTPLIANECPINVSWLISKSEKCKGNSPMHQTYFAFGTPKHIIT